MLNFNPFAFIRPVDVNDPSTAKDLHYGFGDFPYCQMLVTRCEQAFPDEPVFHGGSPENFGSIIDVEYIASLLAVAENPDILTGQA